MSLRGAQRRAAAQPFVRNERYGCGVPPAQPFATKERYGCGVPPAGIAGAISCRHFRLYTNPFVRAVCRLRGRHAESSCPTILERTLAVGRDDSARRCRNYRVHTSLFLCTNGRLIAAPTRTVGCRAVGAAISRPCAGATECIQTCSSIPSAAYAVVTPGSACPTVVKRTLAPQCVRRFLPLSQCPLRNISKYRHRR